MRRRLTTAALLAATAVTLTGCSTSQAPDALHVAAAAFTDLAKPTWTVDASIVGDTVAEKGVVAAYTRSGTTLRVTAWNAKTGEELWHAAAAPGAAPGGVQLDLHLVHHDGVALVPYLTNVDGSFQRLHLKRLDTGASVSTTTKRMYVVDRPDECADEKDLCVNAFVPDLQQNGTANYRLDLATGGIALDPDTTIPKDSRLVGVHLFSTNDRSSAVAEQLGYVASGTVAWQHAYSAMFAPGYSSDNGWSFRDGSTAKVIVGTASAAWKKVSGGYSHDLTKQMAIGIDRATGDVAWRLPGATECNGIDLEADRTTDVVPLCEYTGVTTSYRGGKKATVKDPTATMLGVDVGSGKVKWKHALPAATASLNGPFFGSGWSSTSKVIRLQSGVRLVDLMTGETAKAPKQGAYACTEARKPMKARIPYRGGTQQEGTGSAFTVCDLTGKTTDGRFSRQAVRDVGISAGSGRYVVSTSSGLSGFRL